jgi:ADP-heptose:LPS heptosyltransferase
MPSLANLPEPSIDVKRSRFTIRALIYCAALIRYLGNACIATLRIALWPRRRPFHAARVCVYRIGAIGDLVCATPALFAIRRAYPDAHLMLLTTPGKYGRSRHAEDLLGRAGWIDEIIVYDLDEVRTIRDRLAFGWKLRARKFDAWFDLTLDRAKFTRMIRDMLLARLLGARWACGWRLEHIGFAAKAEAEVKEFPDEVERLAGVLRACGIEGDATSFPPLVDELQDDSTRRFLLGYPAELDGRSLVAIAPGARRSCNLWPTDRFAAVCANLTAGGAAVLLIGGAGDYSMCEQISSRSGSQATNLAGKLSLRESCALLRRCDLLICVDSGPQHLAAAVGTRCVALFSQRNQRRRWYPHGSQHLVLEGSVECHTCLLAICPYDNRCMKQITVEQVLAAAHASLQTNGERPTQYTNSPRQISLH